MSGESRLTGAWLTKDARELGGRCVMCQDGGHSYCNPNGCLCSYPACIKLREEREEMGEQPCRLQEAKDE